MAELFQGQLPIDGAYNMRDLGGYPIAGGGTTAWRHVLRSDSLHRLTPAGVARLHGTGVRTVIDVRQPQERAKAPDRIRPSGGIGTVNISLFDALVPPYRDVAPADRVWELDILVLTSRQTTIDGVLSTIATADEGAGLLHCAAGKDRTGIIAALLLSVAGAGRDTIVADYTRTNRLIAPLHEELVTDAVAGGVDPGWFRMLLGAAPATMNGMLEYINSNLGGVVAYLRGIGLDDTIVGRLRTRLAAVSTDTRDM